MQIEQKNPHDLKPYENNARLNDHAVNDVAASIRQFGFQQPIVVDNDYVIIAGHTRWKAAVKLGLREVPVTVARNLTPAQVAAYRLADNKVAEKSKWNKKQLADEIELLKSLEVDITQLGFDMTELQRMTVNSIIDQINAEPEYTQEDDPAERRYKALIDKLAEIRNKHPEKLRNAKLIILAAGAGRFICIADETLPDFVTEVERNAQGGNETALDRILDKVYPL